MDEKAMAQRAELNRLERAAKESSNPDVIREEAPKPATGRKIAFVVYAVLLLLLFGTQWFLRWKNTGLSDEVVDRALSYIRGAAIVTFVLLGGRLIEVYGLSRLHSAVARYNLRQILRLLIGLAVAFIAVSVIFTNWYTAVVSLGLISLILGFALQTPISSFIGWIYILVKAPYRVGDRIKIAELRGDVIDIDYLDTTLWEFGGDYLSTDHPSGRLIKFPNTRVFSDAVINYSWPLFPYIWQEVKLHVAYETNLDFLAETMTRVAEAELGTGMQERVREYRELLRRTPIDNLDVQERPVVLFRVSDNTWLEAIVRYLVDPRQAGRVKTRLIKKILAELNRYPDKVLFPKSNAR